MQMFIGALTVDLYIQSSASLKDKRIIVKGLKDKIRKKFNVSVAEIDFQEKWQRARLAIVQVSSDYGFINKNIDAIFHLIDSNISFEVIDHNFELI